jgi:hypothetical protein
VVELAWGLTPLRLVTAGVSLLGVVALGVLAWGRLWPLQPRGVIVGLMVAGLLAVCTLPGWSALMPAQADQATDAVRNQRIGDGLVLVGTQIDTSRLESDRLLLAHQTWQVLRPSVGGYRASVEVVTSDGQVVHRAPWVYEPDSGLWERGEIVPTTVSVRLPRSVPGGEYLLRLAFDRPGGVEPVALHTVSVPGDWRVSQTVGDQGVMVGPTLRLGPQPGRNDGPPDPLSVKAGRALDVPLRWEQTGAAPDVSRELQAVAVLAAQSGELLSEVGRPGDWFAPLPFWQAGDVIHQRLRLNVPRNVPTGSYPLSIRVYVRDLARGGASEPGASSARPRGSPVAELSLGTVTVTR